MKLRNLLFLAFAVSPVFLSAQQWQPKKAILMSKFAKDVKPESVLPEYPRPQLVREKWLNLNGVWQFQPATSKIESLPTGNLARTILVPFAVESALSGVMEHHESIWYRRKFNVPTNWKGQDILLHFGAVDYEAEVFVNGKSLGIHTGGYDPFSYNISTAIKGAGEQDIAVRVYDPTDKGGFPRGKQTLNPQGIMYTSVTGIWQTVWLEPVPKTNISNIKIVPDIDKSVVKLIVSTAGNSAADVEIKVKDGTKLVQTKIGKSNTEIIVPVSNAKLWSPDSPFLYDLTITLKKGAQNLDAVSSYFGMRKISIAEEGGFKKMFLNNKFLFQIGPLDQGFWPDGGYTAPTDEALKYDLEMTKKFGFNMVRKHIKVEPYRWYYWADKLGLMVWQDMPSPNSYTEHVPPINKPAFKSELTRVIETHWNSPSIISWVIFNEGQAQHNTAEYVDQVRNLDPTRLINQGSGWEHFGVGDVLDIHSYPPPAVPTSKVQTLACGEYGGIGYIIPGHTWKTGPTYIMIDNEKDYTKLYDDFATDLAIFKTNKGLSAAVYTEITDVEVELNGLITYDREVIKGAVEKIRASNEKSIKTNIFIKDVLPSSQTEAKTWKYTFDQPATEWMNSKFNDAAWKSGQAGFGTKATPGANVKTVWNTDNIWMRREFSLGDLKGINREDLVLYIHHDEDAEVYINGIKAATIPNYTSNYSMVKMSKEAQNALIANGKNVIAIHCTQKQGGQYIDAGIAVVEKK
ncbi:glycoside hydrolase family 2 [Pedobacter frigidisoli]|uniref:Glycoside hydrolase family 2 n=1 Tax=Pedobacter frigidisoli TaxID=2530455 RepID=A0A4R0P9J3_9SPHI|nr:sugar-binding domain-containing protein [Pedobacter frigidisoli]TCD12822.1 glycoside hydrolase family 2 [Pedobacter frigidisoli]